MLKIVSEVLQKSKLRILNRLLLPRYAWHLFMENYSIKATKIAVREREEAAGCYGYTHRIYSYWAW
jgi:hypothetical protein